MVKGSAQPKVLLVSDIHPCAQASNFEAPSLESSTSDHVLDLGSSALEDSREHRSSHHRWISCRPFPLKPHWFIVPLAHLAILQILMEAKGLMVEHWTPQV